MLYKNPIRKNVGFVHLIRCHNASGKHDSSCLLPDFSVYGAFERRFSEFYGNLVIIVKFYVCIIICSFLVSNLFISG